MKVTHYRRAAAAISACVIASCMVDLQAPAGIVLCTSDAECVVGRCLVEAGRCVDGPSACVEQVDGDLVVASAGKICDRADGANGVCGSGICELSFCGDGVVDERTEDCDSGSSNDDLLADACRTNCRAPHCGDGTTDTGEVCDDGNFEPGDDCSNDCASTVVCGNDYLDVNEQCDDGNLGSNDGCDSTCNTEIPLWTPWNDRFAQGALYPGSCFDTNRGRWVVFGGTSEDRPLADTWEFDGVQWILQGPSLSPPARARQAMVFDATRGVCVMFGGVGSTVLNDTWEWNGESWTQVQTTTVPPARFQMGHGFDLQRGVMVVAGGSTATVERSDTWEYDGVDWREVSTAISLPPVLLPAMAYDSDRNVMVMTGGALRNGAGGTTPINTTWEYTGVDWTEITPTQTRPARVSNRMVYDPVRGKMVLYGGVPFAADTWEYDATPTPTWTQRLTPTSPGSRLGYAMEWDPSLNRVLMSRGGGSGLGDTWMFDGSDWTDITPPARPSGRAGHAMTYDRHRGRTVLFGGCRALDGLACSVSDRLGDTWEFDGRQWLRVEASDSPPASWMDSMAYDASRSVVVLFTQQAGEGPDGCTYEFDGTRWHSIVTAQSPSCRQDAKLVYDPINERVVLFGGRDGGLPTNETWSFDGADWSQIATPPELEPRNFHVFAYSSALGQLVTFGGQNVAASYADVWALDGSVWSELAPAPRARWQAGAVEYPPRDSIVLFGGRNAGGETWLFSGSLGWQVVTPAVSPASAINPGLAYDYDRRVAVMFGGVETPDETWEFSFRSASPVEACDSGSDEDGDALTDCEDEDCVEVSTCAD